MTDPILDNQNVPAKRDVPARDSRLDRGDNHLSYSATVLLLDSRSRASARGCILRKIKCNALTGLHHAISARKIANARIGTINRVHDLKVRALIGRLLERVSQLGVAVEHLGRNACKPTRATPIVMKIAAMMQNVLRTLMKTGLTAWFA